MIQFKLPKKFFRIKTKNILLKKFTILTCLAVWILIATVTSIATSVMSNMTQKNFNETAILKTTFISKNIDNFISEIYGTLWSINNSSISDFSAYKPTDKDSLELYDHSNAFKKYISTYSYIDSIWIVNDSMVIDSKTGIHNISEYKYKDFVIKTTNDFNKHFDSFSPYISKIHSINNSEVISFLISDKAYSSRGSQNVIYLNVSLDKFSEKLFDADEQMYYCAYVYSSEHGLINLSPRVADSKQIASTFSGKSSLSGNGGFTQIDKTLYSMYQKNSKILPSWKYLVYYNCTPLLAGKNSIKTLYILTLLATMLLCFVFIYLISSFVYRPMTNLVKNLSANFTEDTATQSTANYNEAALITHHINTLQAELDKKSDFITAYNPTVRSSLIKTLLENREIDVVKINSELSNCDINFTHRFFYVVLFSLNQYITLRSSKSGEEIKKISDFIYTYIYNALSQTCITTGITMNNNEFVFILNTEQILTESEALALGKNINEFSLRQHNCTLSMYFSESTESLKYINNLFSEVQTLKEHGFTLPEPALLVFPYNQPFAPPSKQMVKNSISSIISCIGNEDFHKLLNELNCFFNLHKNSNKETIRYNMKSLTDALDTVCNALSVEYDITVILTHIADIFAYGSLLNLIDYTVNQVLEISSLANSDSLYKNMSQDLKEYIDIYYYKDLSLDSLSEIFKISPSYISRIFSETFEQGFHSYLLDIRINKAKELLTQTNLPIQTISQKVGFLNYNSFSRAFKRHTGLSAKTYRIEALPTADKDK